jgi:glucosamine kinase
LILIADSGSTKADWRFIARDGKIAQFAGSGLNPYFQSREVMTETLLKEIVPQMNSLHDSGSLQIYFYGAGCGNEANCKEMQTVLEHIFKDSRAEVNSDLLGAARGLLGRSKGIAGILGTGMNSGLYDGTHIVEQQASLGYVLGDEGSGAYLGKQLLADYLNKEMSVSVSSNFEKRFALSTADILHKLYREPNPNRFLASFSKFIYQNIAEQYCVDLVVQAFRRFFELHICKYKGYETMNFSCTGSVAFWYSNILRRVAEEKGVNLHAVVESPIAGLALYYSEPE